MKILEKIIHLIFYPAIFILIFTMFYINIPNYVDDAFITLKYARNFLEGNGLVWNIGEYIQGYTNFLHLMLISIFGYFLNDLIISNYIVNFISYFSLALVLYKHQYLNNNKYKNLIIITILSSAPIIVWTLGGMETILFTFFLVFAFFELETKKRNNINYLFSGILVNLAILTRPDASIFAFLYLLIIFFYHKDYNGLFKFISAFVILILYLFWTYSYYGDFVPNTYYVKSYGLGSFKYNFGLIYISFILSRPMFLIPIYLILKFIYRNFKLNKFDLIIFTFMLYIFYVGGDHMTAFRFYAPLIPFLVFANFKIIENKLKLKDFVLKIIILLLISSQLMFNSLMPKDIDKAPEHGELVGKYIDKNWEKNSLIALNTAGSIPYFAKDFKYIDMLGLNDSTISKRKVDSITIYMQQYPGHSKGDGKYVLSRMPDYIIFASAEGAKDSIIFLSDYEIYHSDEFKRKYKFHKTLIEGPQETFYFRYYKRIKK